MTKYKLETANGIQGIHMQVPDKVAYLGILINTGSRDEQEHEQGLAHLVEHNLFKGTQKRSAYKIISTLEDLGGEINAFTTKEETFIYGIFLHEHYTQAFDLLSDILFDAKFDEKELQKEREIVIDEINAYKDSPSEQIFDDFEELLFEGSSFGRNILGTKKSLKKLKSEHLKAFVSRNYRNTEILVVSIGNLSNPKFEKLFFKYFSRTKFQSQPKAREIIPPYLPQRKIVDYKTHQLHCVLGNRAYEYSHAKTETLGLLNSLLAGNSLNSKLVLSLREKHAIAYQIESNYTTYSDTGVFSVYFGTDKGQLDKALDLIFREFKKLRTTPISDLQLRKNKQKIIGQWAIANENREMYLYALARSYFYEYRIKEIDEIAAQVNAITKTDLMDVANEILVEEQTSILVFK